MRKYLRKIKRLTENNSPFQKAPNSPFVFIHINKTGGTSVGKQLGLPRKRHLTVEQVIAEIGREKWNEAYTFAFVRNPWSKVVSHYKYRIKTGQTGMGQDTISFADWVRCTYGPEKDPTYYDKPQMFQAQVDWLKDPEGKVAIDFVGKFEQLSEDFAKVATVLGVSPNLPHLNKTKPTDYKSFYDPESVEHVRNWFKEDIERFGYEF